MDTSSGTDDSSNRSIVKNPVLTEKEWKNKLEYFLSCVSYGVGLGNLWRFPYLCFDNKGFTFLIPYLTCLFCCGMPLCILEGLVGQFSGAGPVDLWWIAPVFRGVGWGQVIMTGLCCVYYNVIVGYGIYYLFYSLPWFGWTLKYSDESDYCKEYANKTTLALGEAGSNITKSCQESFYDDEILMNTDSFTNGLSSLNWPMVLTLVISWLIIYWSQTKGTGTTGKISYITSILPYLCLTALLIGTLNLPGATTVGIKKYVTIDWAHLATSKVWLEAATQVFYSQGASWGVLITFSSHNPFRMNVYKLSWQLSLINAVTSIYSGFVVFSTLGFLALDSSNGNVTLALDTFQDHVEQSHKLAFVVYPLAVSKMPWGILWACTFFIMLITLGVGSQVGMFMCVYETFRNSSKTLKRHSVLFLVACTAVLFLLGLPMVTKAGIQWLHLYDNSLCIFSVKVFALLETLGISYFYGIDKFIDDIEDMLKMDLPLKRWWKLLWMFVTPLFCATLLIVSVINNIKSGFTINSNWPGWVNGLGWMLQIIQFIPLVFCLIKYWNIRNRVDPRFYRRRDNVKRDEELSSGETSSMELQPLEKCSKVGMLI